MTGAPLQPTLKAASTAQHSQLSAVANSTPTPSRAASPARPRKTPKSEPPSNEYLSDAATLSLIRRILIGESNATDRASPGPIEGALPPLTSSNDVDIQLYAIISIVVKDFIQPWYTKITPDQAFVDEVVHIVAHCSRALEQRLRHADIAGLILDEVPAILVQHVEDFQAATISHGSLPYGSDLVQVYHALNPHPALDPALSDDARTATERAHRQLLIQGALAVLLPTEDLQNSSLRILVTDVLADLILGRAINDRLCQGWFLHEMMSKVTVIISRRTHPKITGEEMQADARGRLEKFGLLSSQQEQASTVHSTSSRQSIAFWFWAILQWCYMAVIGLKFTGRGLMHARHLPPRQRNQVHTPTLTGSTKSSQHDAMVLDYSIFSAVSMLLSLSTRMPWLIGILAFFRHILTSGQERPNSTGSIVDRFLHTSITKHLFPPSLIPLLLINLRATIFPQNSLGPAAPPPPTPERALEIRATAAHDLLSLLPKVGVRALFGADQTLEDHDGEANTAQRQVEDILDVFGEARLNKYWIYGIIELIIVRLCPEMLSKTPTELMADRGADWTTAGAEDEEPSDLTSSELLPHIELQKTTSSSRQEQEEKARKLKAAQRRQESRDEKDLFAASPMVGQQQRQQQQPRSRPPDRERRQQSRSEGQWRNEKLRVVTNGS
ncbi:uncharacterized protein AB675_11791 [Cyphellophora attinorum]|uniref:PXA domain-containing protein n=1 Tax=Cyphellophora attinorum TaxID=1664694 RepID=A0A0N1H591_9EURO|nr:uncharacterized protein AB675_11791 [Phialophora attinorum]KPI36834.1 hypothetical protein AB675_11791 [Phialophora attinorum]